ncbi:hypothetical protein AVEN_87845-1 [Araneus ventricosus]|uniref:Uncharacterized protein n=1 Tax=Araneus ventricosus TaxID=182803 RepID=A0A4Y2BBT8_ARAVE|nr:hypothetical protein AVEN_87845-1 [Araneus ventricosus]
MRTMPRWPSGKVSASGQGSRPDSTEDPPCMWACCTLNHAQSVKRPPGGVVRKSVEIDAAQVSSSLSDRGSKLRDPSLFVLLQNGTFNITKLINIFRLFSCTP